MFKTITLPTSEQRRTIHIFVEGRKLPATEGETLAASLLKAGVVPFRLTPVSQQPRAPLCLMGVCFECLVDMDGVRNVQSCMVQTRDGMQVHLPRGARRVGEDR